MSKPTARRNSLCRIVCTSSQGHEPDQHWHAPAFFVGCFCCRLFLSLPLDRNLCLQHLRRDGLAEDEQTETDNPAEASDEAPQKRRFLKRLGPQPVTPEQREEAERIRKLAAKYGTDPTAIVGRLQLSSQYADLAHGARFSDTVARVDLPFQRNFLLRVDLPFHRWIDPNRPGVSSAQGLGDLSVVTGWRVYNTPEYALLIGAVATFPTADEPCFGVG